MLADLWHAPESGKSEPEQRLGTSTIGSSEACMLGGLALKRRWQVARKKAGKSTEKPNLILGINAQVSFMSQAWWSELCDLGLLVLATQQGWQVHRAAKPCSGYQCTGQLYDLGFIMMHKSLVLSGLKSWANMSLVLSGLKPAMLVLSDRQTDQVQFCRWL